MRLTGFAFAKLDKSEEEYASSYLKLRLSEAKAEKQCLFEETKLQESSRASQSSSGGDLSQMLMYSNIHDFLHGYNIPSEAESQPLELVPSPVGHIWRPMLVHVKKKKPTRHLSFLSLALSALQQKIRDSNLLKRNRREEQKREKAFSFLTGGARKRAVEKKEKSLSFSLWLAFEKNKGGSRESKRQRRAFS